MKKLMTFIAFNILLIAKALSVDYCASNLADPDGTIEKLADDVLEATAKDASSVNVLKVTVTYAGPRGSGNVYVMTDENGDIAGLRVDFKINDGKKESMTRTFEELTSANSKVNQLEYRETPNSKPALVVKKSPSAKIYKQTGGEFLFQILTQKSPPKYTDYKVYLRKNDKKQWIVKSSDGVKKSSVDLSPDVDVNLFSKSEWKGTFSSATFQ